MFFRHCRPKPFHANWLGFNEGSGCFLRSNIPALWKCFYNQLSFFGQDNTRSYCTKILNNSLSQTECLETQNDGFEWNCFFLFFCFFLSIFFFLLKYFYNNTKIQIILTIRKKYLHKWVIKITVVKTHTHRKKITNNLKKRQCQSPSPRKNTPTTPQTVTVKE